MEIVFCMLQKLKIINIKENKYGKSRKEIKCI